jgi:hypothetical protein
MLVYEHERTEDIVSRLVTMGNRIRISLIATSMMFWGAVLSVVGLLLIGDAWFLGTLAGLILGFFIGRSSAAMLTVVIEWMAQLLVAQGGLVSATKEP